MKKFLVAVLVITMMILTSVFALAAEPAADGFPCQNVNKKVRSNTMFYSSNGACSNTAACINNGTCVYPENCVNQGVPKRDGTGAGHHGGGQGRGCMGNFGM